MIPFFFWLFIWRPTVKNTRVKIYDFQGAYAPPLVASRDGSPWCSKITKTAGTPYVKTTTNGMDLLLDATSEVQVACLYHGDILTFPIADLVRVSFLAKLSSAALNAAITASFGVASAQSDTLASITAAALFRITGGSSNTLVLDARDGTNAVLGGATGETIGTEWRRYTIDFSAGLAPAAPPGTPRGGSAAIQFFTTDANFGTQKRIGLQSQFNMSAYSSNLQLFAQIQKTGVAAGGTLSIKDIETEYRLSG